MSRSQSSNPATSSSARFSPYFEAWDRGLREFAAGRFWHAHEAWEWKWTSLPSPHKEQIQALIQVCGVLVHLERGRWSPAERLALRATHLLAEARAHETLRGEAPLLRIVGVEDFLLRLLAEIRLSTVRDVAIDARLWGERVRELQAERLLNEG